MFYEFVSGKYKHAFYLTLILTIILSVFFKVIFLNYLPESKKISEQTKDFYFENKDDVLWNSNLFSGMPWLLNDNAFADPILDFIETMINSILGWRLIFLFLAASGIYVFLCFLKMEGAPAFLGSIFFLLSGYLIKYMAPGMDATFRAITLLPWLIFFMHYLHKRTSLLAAGGYLFFLIVFLGQVQFQVIFFYLLLSFIYWLVQFFLDFRDENSKRFFRFTLMMIGIFAVAVLALTRPYYHLFQFIGNAQSTLLSINTNEFFLLLFLVGSSVAFNFLLYLSLEANFLKEKFLPDLLQIVGILIMFTLVCGFLVDRFILDLNIPDKYFLLTILICVFLFVLLAYAREKIHRATFQFVLFILTLGGFLLLNFDFFRDLKKMDQVLPEYEPTLTDDFLAEDYDLFRIYPLENEFNNNAWCILNQSIGGDYPILVRRYDKILQYCLHHEIINRVPLNWNIINMLNVKYFIHNDKLNLNNLEYAFYDIKKNLTVYRNSHYLPRAWYVEELEVITRESDIRKRLNNPEFDPAKTAILEVRPETEVFPPENMKIGFHEYSDEKIVIETETDTTSFLVISEVHYPEETGWTAFLDGTETRIYTANYILRGIIVPSGNHNIELIYRPRYYNSFTYFSVGGLLLSILFILIGFYIYWKNNYRGEIVYRIKR